MKGYFLVLILFVFSTAAFGLDCSKHNFSKSQCSSRLKSLQNYFGPFYREGNVFRTVGCRESDKRGEKDVFCNENKCDAISYIESCGIKSFGQELLPVMSEGGEDEIVVMLLQKYPKLIENIDPEDRFWSDYFNDKRVFFISPNHLKIKLALYEKGFDLKDGRYMKVLENDILRDKRDEKLKTIYESSKFKKDTVIAAEDVKWITNLMLNGGGTKGKSLNGITVSDSDFSRISENYLNATVSAKDLLGKKVELTNLSIALKKTPTCYDKETLSSLISTKKVTKENEAFIDYEIDCLKISSREDIISMMDSLNQNGMLSRDLFEKLYSKLNKSDDFTEKEIVILTNSVATFDKETALKLSLLDFNSIHDFAKNLNTEECPENSKPYKILINLHQKIINDQTLDFFKMIEDPNVSYEDLDKIIKTKKLNYYLETAEKKNFYGTLANVPESRFTEEQWKSLTSILLDKSFDVAIKQVSGVNNPDDKAPFGDAIRNQNVTLFKIFVEIKKQRPNYHFGDEKKSALTINRKAGGNDEIQKILRKDDYFKN